jgi:acyl-CoA dehydrogenase
MTEDDAGSDLSRIATQARLDGAEYVVEGAKTFISNAGIADFYTVVAATAPPGTARRLSAFVVPAEADGVRTRPIAMLGGHPIGRVEFAGVRIPAWHRIGEEGDGLAIALEVLTKFRPTVGAAAVGFAQRALDETLCHVRSREQFGGPLSDLQAVQVALADMACEIEGSRLLVYRAAAIADAAERQNGADGERQIRANGAEPRSRRSRVVRTASMAKLVATEAAFRVIDRAVQLHGGRGLLQGGVIARLYQDVRALRIYEGASEIQRLLITRELFR